MKILLSMLLLLWLTHPAARAQNYLANDNLFKVTQNQPIAITYENVDELLSEKVIPNAFSIQVNASTQLYQVYCKVVSVNAQMESLANQISLRPSGTNQEIKLSLTPKLLLERQPGSGSAILHYDAVIHRQDSWLPQGSYNFSIQFTLVRP